MLDGQVFVVEPSDDMLPEEGVAVPFVSTTPPDVQAVSNTSNTLSASNGNV